MAKLAKQYAKGRKPCVDVPPRSTLEQPPASRTRVAKSTPVLACFAWSSPRPFARRLRCINIKLYICRPPFPPCLTSLVPHRLVDTSTRTVNATSSRPLHPSPLSGKNDVCIAITGAAGQIAYALIPLIMHGRVFGEARKVRLRLLDIEACAGALAGVAMEIKDCYPDLVSGILVAESSRIKVFYEVAVFGDKMYLVQFSARRHRFCLFLSPRFCNSS